MTTNSSALAHEAALYPPTVDPAQAPLSVPGFLLRFVRNPLSTLPRLAYEDPIVVQSVRNPIAYVTGPALVEQVLLHDAERFPKTPLEKRVFAAMLGDGILTSQGASWRWQRRTTAPLFRPADLASLVPAMTAAAEEQLARWRAGDDGTVRRIDRDMTETTFRLISATMFAGSADADAHAIMQAADGALATISWDIAAAMLRVPEWMWYPGRIRRRRAGQALQASVAAILERRRASGIEGNDLLGRLALAKDPEHGAPMSDEQLVDNLVTFLAAGHETTAKALTWTLYLLARAPRWQERLRDEIEAVAGHEPVGAGHLDRLTLTRAVFKEAMRLYPPAPMMSRLVGEDLTLGPVALARGTLIMIPVFAIHRHRRLWTDADRFDPERFTPERESTYARTQYMPFGFGARTCIGMSFAMMEGIAILATLVRGARFEWDGVHAPQPLARVTLRPKGGMPLKVWRRRGVV